MAADPHRIGRILRFAAIVDFVLALGLLLSPRFGAHLDPFVVNAMAAALLFGAVVTFILARRMDRMAEAAPRGELPGPGRP